MADQPIARSTVVAGIGAIHGAFFIQRGTILISFVAASILAFPAVTREIYRVLADDAYHLTSLKLAEMMSRGVTWFPICLAFLTLFLASATIWYVGRDLAGQVKADDPNLHALKAFLLRWLPVALALLLPLGAAWGMYQASLDAQAIGALHYDIAQPLHPDYPSPMTATEADLKRLIRNMGAVALLLRGGAYISLALAGVLLLCTVWIDWRRRGAAFGAAQRTALLVLAAAIMAFFTCSVSVPILTGVPRWVGSVALFNFFIIALTLFVGFAILITNRFGIPVLLILIALAVALSVLDNNDNHVVSQVESKNSGRLKAAATEFKTWISSRGDRSAYQTEPYPVFVVSAAGGGLYAAQHAARFLARIQDHCPHFAQHIFAISGVSGGSVGASVFASLVNTKATKQEPVPTCKDFGERPGPLERDVNAILSRDFLAPIVAATLFSDFLQRFIPTPIAQFDRGQVLDKVLEAAWRKRFRSAPNPLTMPMLDLWDPQGVTPALVLNATHVATGGRFAMAPFMPRREDQTAVKLEWLQGHLQNSAFEPSTGFEDLKLSSAAGISARFPWIMPPATVNAKRQNKDRKNTILRLVDGGYFENSGTDTAGDIIRAVESVKGSDVPPFKVYALVLTSYDNEVFGGNFNDETPLGEFIAPIRGLLSTRQARGDVTIIRTLDYLCPDLDNCRSDPDTRGWHNKAKWIFATLNLQDSRLPLSWQLSEFSRRFIGLHGGNPADCGNAVHGIVPLWTGLPTEPVPPPPLAPPRVMAALNNANCAASIVCGQLANRKLAFAAAEGKLENYCTSWDAGGPTTSSVTPATRN
jgi:patatin-like phospholipase